MGLGGAARRHPRPDRGSPPRRDRRADQVRRACYADLAYQGAGPLVAVPFRRRPRRLSANERAGNRSHDRNRGPGERAVATLKTWKTLAKLRCRKQRCTPLTKSTARLLRQWITQRRAAPTDPLFPARLGGHLSRDAIADLLAKYLPIAAATCPTLASKNVTPHTLRHTAAMDLLTAGVDTSTIALWLGHASTKATDIYLHADMALKEKALARTAPRTQDANRYRPTDSLLAFLENL